MSTVSLPTSTAVTPAALGGKPAFPEGLALMRPLIPDLPVLERRLGSILSSGNLTNGPAVRLLEERVAERLDVGHVVAVSSCTSGLLLVLQALGVKGHVVMPSFTFSASAHAVAWAGGEPAFADVDPASLCLDPVSAARLTDGARAMTATHIYGTPCQTESLAAVAARADIPLVYDAAHGLGSVRQGRPIGGFGTAEVFSLSPTKVLFAGEGGLVSTNDDELARAVVLGRNYGNPGDYDCVFPGLNARMSELHAAVALHCLQWLDDNVAHRNELVEQFWSAVAGAEGLRRPTVAAGDVSTYKDLTLLVESDRFGLSTEQLVRALDAEGVETRRYYFPAVHEQKAYQHLPSRHLPVTTELSRAVVSVPLWSHMTVAQIRTLADAIVRIHTSAAQIRATERRGTTT